MLKKIIILGVVLVAAAVLVAGVYAMSSESSSTATQVQRRDQVSRSSAVPAQQGASAIYQQAAGNGLSSDACAQAAACGQQSNRNRGARGNGRQGQGGYGPGTNMYTPLSEAEINGLQRAILEEYGALSLYQSVIADFGDAAPFSAVAASEQRHLDTLLKMAEKYGVDVPELVPPSDLPEFADLFAACEAAQTAEIVDGALYDELMGFTSHTDLIRVYTNLQKASLENHLPAFEACQ